MKHCQRDNSLEGCGFTCGPEDVEPRTALDTPAPSGGEAHAPVASSDLERSARVCDEQAMACQAVADASPKASVKRGHWIVAAMRVRRAAAAIRSLAPSPRREGAKVKKPRSAAEAEVWRQLDEAKERVRPYAEAEGNVAGSPGNWIAPLHQCRGCGQSINWREFPGGIIGECAAKHRYSYLFVDPPPPVTAPKRGDGGKPTSNARVVSCQTCGSLMRDADATSEFCPDICEKCAAPVPGAPSGDAMEAARDYLRQLPVEELREADTPASRAWLREIEGLARTLDAFAASRAPTGKAVAWAILNTTGHATSLWSSGVRVMADEECARLNASERRGRPYSVVPLYLEPGAGKGGGEQRAFLEAAEAFADARVKWRNEGRVQPGADFDAAYDALLKARAAGREGA